MEPEKKAAMQDLFNVAMELLLIQRETIKEGFEDSRTMTINQIEKAEKKWEKIRVESNLDKYEKGYKLSSDEN